jgi:hypothetical protein
MTAPASAKIPAVCRVAMLACITLLAAASALAQPDPDLPAQSFAAGCYDGHGENTAHLPSGLVVRIAPSNSSRKPCSVEISNAAGKVLYAAATFGIRLHEASGSAPGFNPNLVLEQLSAPAGPYKYTVFSLNPFEQWMVLRNSHPLKLRVGSGRTVFSTLDGALDDLVPNHEFAPGADVFLQLDGRRLRDVSPDYRRDYDRAIDLARQRLWARDLQSLRDNGPLEQPEMRQAILTIVVEYLYSGREKQAWQALEDMWPPMDRERIKQAIQNARARGILSQLAAP